MVYEGRLPAESTHLSEPIAIIEVIPKHSAPRHHVETLPFYRELPSLKHYVLVEHDRVLIDHYVRTADGWRGEVPLETLDGVLRLAAIDFEMPVAEVYRDVLPAPAA
jgi:hypothetical protein